MEDRISELPELVISCILSKLTLKDVIKTGALSKSWNKQHRELIHQLNFDMSNLFEREYDKHESSSQDDDSFCNVTVQFINRVIKVLRHFKKGSSKIRSFKVCFYMTDFVSSIVDRWICYAIAFGVEDLQLLFSSQPFFQVMRQEYRLYQFPYSLFEQKSSLKHLFLQNCILTPPSNFTGFTKLFTLRLEEVTLGQDFNIFPNILQELNVTRCEFSQSSILRVVTTSLRKLKLLNNRCNGLLKVEISAVNLVSFEYKPYLNTEITLLHAPRLAKVFYCHTDEKEKLPHLLSHLKSVANLEILSYILYPVQANKLPSAGLSAFRNLKQLTLFYLGDAQTKQDFIWLIDVLKASPLLQKLHLTLHVPSFSESQKKLENFYECAHKNLKEVEMGGCCGLWQEIDLILFILKNAIALERMIIHPWTKIYNGDEKWVDSKLESFWFSFGRYIFQRSLQNNTPERVQLVIL